MSNPGLFNAVILLVVLLLCGCGGGTDTADEDGTSRAQGVVNTEANAVTGLIPAAPALGPTIASDATDFRPIRDGAIWQYNGEISFSTRPNLITYVTRTTQTASSNTVAQEDSSNSGDEGPDTQKLVLKNGVVAADVSIDFAGKGKEEVVRFIELRSPVRQDDQFTIWDRRYTNTNIDADGDGRPDTLDIAIYGRVIGVEKLKLENLPALSTVRVDVKLRSRITYSSTGTPSPVVEGLVKTWYARGIGIVRQRSSTPEQSSNGVMVVDERLTYWDGIKTGFGANPAQLATVPMSSPDQPGMTLSDVLRGAAVIHDHALVVTAKPFTAGATISRLDKRGNVVSARFHDKLPVSQTGFMVPYADGLLYLRQQTPQVNEDDLSPIVKITRYNSDGGRVGAVDGVLIDLRGTKTDTKILGGLQATVEGDTLWLLWRRWTSTDTELLLRPFALDGTPIGPEHRLQKKKDAFGLKLTGIGGRALVTWGRYTPDHSTSGVEVLYTSVAPSDETFKWYRLASDISSTEPLLIPVASGPQGVLVWSFGLADTPTDATAGVVIKDNFKAARAGDTLGSEVLEGLPPLAPYWPVIGATPDHSLLVFSQDTAVHWLAPDDTKPLTKAKIFSVGFPRLDTLESHLVFADRVIVLSSVGDKLHTTVVWLNPGAAP